MTANNTQTATGAENSAAQMTKEELFNACIRDLTSRQGKTFSEAYDIMSEGAAGDLFADLFPPKTVYAAPSLT